MPSGNKKEKASDFQQSDEILRDVLFGVRKSNVTDETRSIYTTDFTFFFYPLTYTENKLGFASNVRNNLQK